VEGFIGVTSEDLREKVIHMLDNPEEAAKMGRNARIRVENEFSLLKLQQAWQSYTARLL
jgi:glycosyltransferase involved in cell wall biosynthesis